MTILPAADLTLKKLGLGVRVNREGFVVGNRSRQIEGKNLRYRGTIPFCLHIVI
jgi:hypothetical protein